MPNPLVKDPPPPEMVLLGLNTFGASLQQQVLEKNSDINRKK